MSVLSTYNVGVGLNFAGQGDEHGIDVELKGYAQEQYYAPYPPGMQTQLQVILIFSDYNSPPAITASPNEQFFMPRMSPSEGDPVISLIFWIF